MPFKRKGSNRYWMGPFRAGSIDIPRMSTGQKTKRTASDIEAAMHDLTTTGWVDLVQRVADKELTPAELYTAKVRGHEALMALRNNAEDPLLIDLILGPKSKGEQGEMVRKGGFRDELADDRHRDGLDMLLALAPANARLSYLKEPKNLQELYRRALRGEDEKGKARRRGPGRRPHTVRRSLHQGIAALLKAQLGRGAMLAIMGDVKAPGGNDERTVMLSVREIDAILSAADDEFRPVIAVALTTGIDRTPLQRMTVRSYDEEQGVLAVVNDTKTAARPRILILRGEPVLENAEPWLRALVAGKKAGDPVCTLTNRQIQKRWEAVRAQVGRPDVRWKDLRGVFATHYLMAGGDPRNLQLIMGHATMAMTLRYLRRLPAGNRERLKEHARTMGQWRGPVKLEREGTG